MMRLGTPEVSDRQVGRTMSQPKPPCHGTSLPAHARVTAGRLVLRGPQAAGGRPPGRGLRLEPGGRASPFFLHCFSIKVIVTESGFFRTPPHATYITLTPSTPLRPAWGPRLSPGKAPPKTYGPGRARGTGGPGELQGRWWPARSRTDQRPSPRAWLPVTLAVRTLAGDTQNTGPRSDSGIEAAQCECGRGDVCLSV